MRAHPLSDSSTLLVLDPGEEAVAALEVFARERNAGSAFFQAIGAFERATLAYWNRESKAYEDTEIDEQVEVVSLLGDVTHSGDGWRVHAHALLGRRDLTTLGGHLKRGVVYPTLELVVTLSSARVDRRRDPNTGLELILD